MPRSTAIRTGRRSPSRRRKKKPTLRRRLDQWRKRLRHARHILDAVPPAIRTLGFVTIALALFALTNLIYQVVRKPAEMFFPVSGVLRKMPAETWRQYGPLFREMATESIPPELLAALAQMEGAGDPVAHTYWRWQMTWHPYSIFKPASSAVGMYQMTDPAFADARHFCIRHHVVVAEGAWDDWHACWFNALYTRVVPSHAIELTAVSLDRGLAALLPKRSPAPTAQEKQDTAALIHLCGPTPAKAFVQRGFQLAHDERCGDHDPAFYLAQVNAMKRQFRHMAETEK